MQTEPIERLGFRNVPVIPCSEKDLVTPYLKYYWSDLIITVFPFSRNLAGLSLDHGRQTGINTELLGSSEYSRTGSSNLIRAISFR